MEHRAKTLQVQHKQRLAAIDYIADSKSLQLVSQGAELGQNITCRKTSLVDFRKYLHLIKTKPCLKEYVEFSSIVGAAPPSPCEPKGSHALQITTSLACFNNTDKFGHFGVTAQV